uniref:Uncharacterized protein n=1 Tax=Ditylum brightwellii TaxID=49249 RepID=A0A7S4V6Y0_9STRA
MPHVTLTTAKSDEPEDGHDCTHEQKKDTSTSAAPAIASNKKPGNTQDSTDEATKSPRKRKRLGERKSRRRQNQEAESVDSMLEKCIANNPRPRLKRAAMELREGGHGGRYINKKDKYKWNLHHSSKPVKAVSKEEYSVIV